MERRRPFGLGGPFGFGRPYGFGFGGPLLGGVLGRVLGSKLIPPFGYGYLFYGGYPLY